MYTTSVDLLTVSTIIFEVVIELSLHSISVDSYRINGAHTCSLSLPPSLHPSLPLSLPLSLLYLPPSSLYPFPPLSLSVTVSMYGGYWIEL